MAPILTALLCRITLFRAHGAHFSSRAKLLYLKRRFCAAILRDGWFGHLLVTWRLANDASFFSLPIDGVACKSAGNPSTVLLWAIQIIEILRFLRLFSFMNF